MSFDHTHHHGTHISPTTETSEEDLLECGFDEDFQHLLYYSPSAVSSHTYDGYSTPPSFSCETPLPHGVPTTLSYCLDDITIAEGPVNDYADSPASSSFLNFDLSQLDAAEDTRQHGAQLANYGNALAEPTHSELVQHQHQQHGPQLSSYGLAFGASQVSFDLLSHLGPRSSPWTSTSFSAEQGHDLLPLASSIDLAAVETPLPPLVAAPSTTIVQYVD